MLFEKIKLEAEEKILLIVHRHWFVFLMRAVGIGFTALVPFFIFFIALSFEQSAELLAKIPPGYGDEAWFISAVWLLINWCALAYIWTDHYLDVWVITDRRIISIDQKNLFDRSIGSFRLERLQDMNIEIPGFLATMFKYGKIEAQTASGDSAFTVTGMPKPREIKSLILEAADTRMKEVRSQETSETNQEGL